MFDAQPTGAAREATNRLLDQFRSQRDTGSTERFKEALVPHWDDHTRLPDVRIR